MIDERNIIKAEMKKAHEDVKSFETEMINIESEIHHLQKIQAKKRKEIEGRFEQLLCLSSVYATMFAGEVNKISLMRLYRFVFNTSLKEAKDSIQLQFSMEMKDEYKR